MLGVTLGGCLTKTTNRGHVIPSNTLEQIQTGSSREQVQLVLGTPSTTSTIGGEAFYYISQREEQTAFLAPDIVEQRVVAIYFDEEGRVSNLGDYGLKDGKVFDFIKPGDPHRRLRLRLPEPDPARRRQPEPGAVILIDRVGQRTMRW